MNIADQKVQVADEIKRDINTFILYIRHRISRSNESFESLANR